jgi:hypothetical protein
MRLLPLLAAAGLATTALKADGVDFIRIWPNYRDTDSFKRISEYFTNREDPGKVVMLRTQPVDRDGYYWVIRVDNKETILDDAKFVLDVITPDSPHPKTFIFPTRLPKGQTVYDVGLTGTDWHGKREHPVAYRMRLEAGDGTSLVDYKSFLWEKPES